MCSDCYDTDTWRGRNIIIIIMYWIWWINFSRICLLWGRRRMRKVLWLLARDWVYQRWVFLFLLSFLGFLCWMSSILIYFFVTLSSVPEFFVEMPMARSKKLQVMLTEEFAAWLLITLLVLTLGLLLIFQPWIGLILFCTLVAIAKYLINAIIRKCSLLENFRVPSAVHRISQIRQILFLLLKVSWRLTNLERLTAVQQLSLQLPQESSKTKTKKKKDKDKQ